MKPGRVQEAFGQCSQAHDLSLGDVSVQQDQELDLMILGGHFQPRIFYESVI